MTGFIQRFLFLLLISIMLVHGAYADIVVIPVTGVIDGGLAAFIERSIDEATEMNARAILFHIDTPGGRVDSAVRIKDTILKTPITTIAFIDKNAISAGALISIACDSVYMSTGSSIGAATAVDLQGKKASEKIISYFRAQMRSTAEANGRPTDIAEAMVDEELEIKGISENGKLVTLTYGEALKYGISDGTYETIEDAAKAAGHGGETIVTMSVNWAEYIVRFLTHPIVSSLLMSIGFLGLLIEIRTPGWGLGGTIALIALALFFGSHYLVHLAGLLEFIVFAAGIILLALEIFVIPGFGIAGVSGIALIILSLFLSLMGHIPTIEDVRYASWILGGAFVMTLFGGIILLRVLPRTRMFDKMVLAEVQKPGDGYIPPGTVSDLVGVEGIALTDLHPTGIANIGGRRLDVITEGDYLKMNTAVIVTEVHGSRIIVRART